MWVVFFVSGDDNNELGEVVDAVVGCHNGGPGLSEFPRGVMRIVLNMLSSGGAQGIV